MSMDRRTLLKGLAVAGAGAVAPVEASEKYAEAPADAVSVTVAGGVGSAERILGDEEAKIDDAGVLRIDALGAHQVAAYRLE